MIPTNMQTLKNYLLLILCWWYLSRPVHGAAMETEAAASASFATSASYVRRNRNRRTEELYEPFVRIIFPQFQLVLAKTTAPFSHRDVDHVHGILQRVIHSYVQVDKRASFPTSDTELLYLFLGDTDQRFINEQTILTFPRGGVAAFRGTPPSVGQLEVWIKEAVEKRLVEALQVTPFSFIDVSLYISDTVNRGGDSVGIEQPTIPSNDPTSPFVIVGSTVGAVAVLGLVALLAARAKNDKENERRIDTRNSGSTESYGRSPPYDSPAGASAVGAQGFIRTTDSMVGSESSFTVNSEPGDSAAIKSLPSESLPLANALTAESFERDVRVNLRKDMLTSTWISPTPTGRAAEFESVLAPSYFSVSGERKDIRNLEDGDDAWNLSEGEVRDNAAALPVLFESAHNIHDETLL